MTLTRPVTSGFAARLSGVPTKEAADALRGTRLYAPRAALPSLPDDEFYHADLIGLTALDTGGAALGSRDAQPRARATCWNCAARDSRAPSSCPSTRANRPQAPSLAAGRVIIDRPEGLLENDTPSSLASTTPGNPRREGAEPPREAETRRLRNEATPGIADP